MAIEDFIAARIYDDELEAEALLSATVEGWVARRDRLLIEARAKRGILLEWMMQRRRSEVDPMTPAPSPRILQYLALPYRDHPDYLPAAWTPPEPGTVETWGRR